MCGWFSLCKLARGREVCLGLIAALPSMASLRLPSVVPSFLLVLNPPLIYEAFQCGCVTRFEAERGSERRFVFAGFCVLLCAHFSQLASQSDLCLASPALAVMRGLA